MREITAALATTCVLFALISPSSAQVKIGIVVSATGPASSLGVPERNALSLAPKRIGDQDVEYVVLDDATDPTNARRHIERLTTDERVDLVIGSSTSPSSLAMVEVAGRTQTPMISLGASRAIIHPMDDAKRWVFKTPYNDATTAAATVDHMTANGVSRVATVAVNDAYGEGWIQQFRPLAEKAGIEIVASEVYGAKDTSVTAQALKVLASNPDAVLVAASGTPGALPQAALAERNFRGKIYQTTGVVNADYIRVGGRAVEGVFIAANPLSVASQLPDGHAAKEAAVAFTQQYDSAFGQGSTSAFSGYAWDAVLIAQAAIPEAAKLATPGTPEFRSALRDAIEGLNGVATTAGPITMTAEDHNGYAPDAPIIITVTDGRFVVAN
ncbi:branched-chain amino acid ABC transporter substrate-binding protein [Mesorhizobium sp. L-8-10]|uniref:ABC transporter substrate-binding protein n=1 Tax=Mesorhizobium sp. L-8-10 TaxID=2744523 RepID=UPI0019256CDB|nr:ABC transporter substrate-binding protein [Mesorhizobium sp. L-8-10]BCH29865.1 branched-chain amino acid ABC transporter substrate-binding protein [Mesorhizobium sp. L-8-10]